MVDVALHLSNLMSEVEESCDRISWAKLLIERK